jgi:glutamate-ammonia-ligase adenylyltransferase
MPFASRLTRAPIPFEPEPASEVRAGFADLPPGLQEVLAGAAGCSPYLAGLMRREAPWLREALAGEPEAALDQVLAALRANGPDEPGAALREAKRRVALLVALADLGGVWGLAEVTGALTALADRAVSLALETLLGDEIRRGRLPGLTDGHDPSAAGLFVIAMGKMGAGELNYSSDIDLICLFDETRFDADARAEARAAFIRVVRRMTAMLSDATRDGYVFRTDLRLRPDASVTPVCIPAGAAEQYYEAQGRTWERAAYIKARVCAGDIAAGERFLAALAPFVWRRHLDFAAIRDAHDMRLRIRDHKGLGGSFRLDGHDVKLGQGGIRDIEFFAQTRQIIAGGRDPDLRARGTEEALAALAAKGWVSSDEAARLGEAYRAHRELEHRLQMVADQQTQAMPGSAEGFDRLARFMGEGDTARFRVAAEARFREVAALTEGFFDPGEVRARPEISEAARALIDGWRSYPALRSERAVAIFKRLEPDLIERLGRAASPEEALHQFDAFLSRLPAGVQLFSLFQANPQLVDLIVDICATAPGLATYLARNAGVFDAVIGGEFFTPWPGPAGLVASLHARLAGAGDYEARLNAARVWLKEWHFRVGVHHLRGIVDAGTAGRQYADLAGAVLAAVWEACEAEFARRHGRLPGRGAMVLGMGSLGAERLNAASDLDLIVIYDSESEDVMSDGPKPLAVRPYFARLTQALVTALTAPMAEGRLYEVDMRLRPSGRQGPVAVSLPAFRDYQMGEAWTWEHLALTRARPVAGDPGLAAAVEAIRREVLAAKAGGAGILADVAAMRERVFAAKPAGGGLDVKAGPGGLMDIELLAQSFALRSADPARRIEAQLRAGRAAGLIGRAEAEALDGTARLFWRVHAGTRLLADRDFDLGRLGEGGRAFLLREAGATDTGALVSHLAGLAAEAAAIVQACLGGGQAVPGEE